MKKSFKNIFKKKTKVKNVESIESLNKKDTVFELKYKKLLIGTLTYDYTFEEWVFAYSEAFKNQTKIDTLLLFPDSDKTYKSKELWTFFLSRIPDNTSKVKINKEKTSNIGLIELLKSYGQRTITNPFDLSVA